MEQNALKSGFKILIAQAEILARFCLFILIQLAMLDVITISKLSALHSIKNKINGFNFSNELLTCYYESGNKISEFLVQYTLLPFHF